MCPLDMAFSRDLETIAVVMFLSWMVSGAQQEMSITRGDTAEITCPFGDGVLRNVSWYFIKGAGQQVISNLIQGHLTIDPSYADRAGLPNDNSSIFILNMAVKDEGVYRCEVDRQDNSQVVKIETKLKVYGLSPNTSPTITQSPSGPANCSSTNLTCTLPHIYPSTNASLTWFHEGRGPFQATFSTSRPMEDGTFELTSTIGAPENGNWTCKASYLSMNGIEHTSTSISVTIDDTEDKDSPVNLVAIIVPIVLVIAVIIVVVGIVVFLIKRRKRKNSNRAKGQYGQLELGARGADGIEDEILVNLAEALQDEDDISKIGRNLGFRQFKLNQIIRENERANDVFATTSMLFDWKKKTPAAKQIATMVKVLAQSDMEHLITQFFPNEAGVSDEKLTELAESLEDEDDITRLGVNFGFRQFKVNQYIKTNKDHGDHSGTLAMLKEWRKKTPRTRQIVELVEALKNSNLDSSSNIKSIPA